jgi:hypothetical protein
MDTAEKIPNGSLYCLFPDLNIKKRESLVLFPFCSSNVQIIIVSLVYCFDAETFSSLHKKQITVSNGLTWSLDKKTMYYIDSPTQKVFAYDYNNLTSEISNKRPVVSITGTHIILLLLLIRFAFEI